jgi:L-methionine (R)-S-oxide reductase
LRNPLDFSRRLVNFSEQRKDWPMIQHPLLSEIESFSKAATERDDFLMESARAINRHLPHCNWVGFYFLKDGRLHVGPYLGKPTPHTVIELDRGICGAAVSQGKTIVVDDVNADPRYLACSLETRSEIVVPLTVDGRIIGELDIDSDKKAAFGEQDRAIMEEAAVIIGRALERWPV